MSRRTSAMTNFTMATSAPITITTAPQASTSRTMTSTTLRSVDSGRTSSAYSVSITR